VFDKLQFVVVSVDLWTRQTEVCRTFTSRKSAARRKYRFEGCARRL